ncbi:MAG: cupin domain-containing protein [Acidobacteriaceae bacterium]|nr:cupin domain-containing protein [Acidobacteriaceae bacterium]MBV8571358.1 cupin domain-containing protein [Acidobacteriaceae bacterium]
MDLTRRELNAFWALLTGANHSTGAALPSRCFSFQDLPVRVDPKTHAEFRQVFKGVTHDGVPIDLHITTMPPGEMPHPPHHHVHEEMMMVQQGKLEATISGKTSTAGPGSVIYILSNEEHGLRSVGDTAAQYFVLAIGEQTTS